MATFVETAFKAAVDLFNRWDEKNLFPTIDDNTKRLQSMASGTR